MYGGWRGTAYWALLLTWGLAYAGTGDARANVRIESYETRDLPPKIVISGRIDETTLMEFSQAIGDSRVTDSRPPLVELNSPGGSVYAAIAIGTFLRRLGFDTGVLRGGRCDSACVLILAAGVRRTAAPGKVGIHRPYFHGSMQSSLPQAEVEQNYTRLTEDIQHYLGNMGVQKKLLHAMLNVPSDRIRVLTMSEVETFGLASAARQRRHEGDHTDGRREVSGEERSENAAVRQQRVDQGHRQVRPARHATKKSRTAVAELRHSLRRVVLHASADPPPWSATMQSLHHVVQHQSFVAPPWSAAMLRPSTRSQRRR